MSGDAPLWRLYSQGRLRALYVIADRPKGAKKALLTAYLAAHPDRLPQWRARMGKGVGHG